MGVQRWLQVGLKKYQSQRQKGSLEKTSKKATKWLKKASFLETDDLKIIDYNNDANLVDVANVNYNNNTHSTDLNNEVDWVDLKNTLTTQKTAKT